MGAVPQVQPQQPVVIRVQAQDQGPSGSWMKTAFRVAVFGAAVYAAWHFGFAQGASSAAREGGTLYQQTMDNLAGMKSEVRDQAFASWNAVKTGMPTTTEGTNTSLFGNISQYVPARVMEFFNGVDQTPAGQFAEQVLNQTQFSMPNIEVPGADTLKALTDKADQATFWGKGLIAYLVTNSVLKSPVASLAGKGVTAFTSLTSPLARRAFGR